MKKRLISLFLCIPLCLSLLTLTTHAYTYDYPYATKNYPEAFALYKMGMLSGKGNYSNGMPAFELEDGSSRAEGLVLALRLLGEEQNALAYEGDCPFTDVPAWASKYVAYAYNKGYVTGTSPTTFNPNGGLFDSDYVAMVLYALGYGEEVRKAPYGDACDFAVQLGVARYGDIGGYMRRSGCVKIAFSALGTKLKNSNQTLAEKLMEKGVLSGQAVQESGVLSGVAPLPDHITVDVPVQNWSERKSIHYLLASLPDKTYAYELKEFKHRIADLDTMGGIKSYSDPYEDIDLNTAYTNYSSFENHTNAEVRQFIEDYVKNFDPSYLFAEEYPKAPDDFRHDVEIWSRIDYEKSKSSIELGRTYWKENLAMLRFSAILADAPGNMRYTMRSWQIGTMSDAALKNYFDQWIAVGGVYKNFKISVQ